MRKRTDQDQQVNLSEEVSEKEKRFGNMTRKYYQNERRDTRQKESKTEGRSKS